MSETHLRPLVHHSPVRSVWLTFPWATEDCASIDSLLLKNPLGNLGFRYKINRLSSHAKGNYLDSNARGISRFSVWLQLVSVPVLRRVIESSISPFYTRRQNNIQGDKNIRSNASTKFNATDVHLSSSTEAKSRTWSKKNRETKHFIIYIYPVTLLAHSRTKTAGRYTRETAKPLVTGPLTRELQGKLVPTALNSLSKISADLWTNGYKPLSSFRFPIHETIKRQI